MKAYIPQNEIAAFLDISVNTVKNRLRSARKRLKERLLIMVEENLQQARPSKDERFAEAVHRIIAPSQDKDAEAIYDLLENKLQRPDMASQARHGRIAGSHYDWATSRIALDGDELAAHVGIYEIKTEDLPTALPDVRLQEILRYDVQSYPGVAELYNRENEGVSMTAVRPTYPHGKCPSEPGKSGKYGPAYLLLDENEKLVGYFMDPLVYNAAHDNGIGVSDSAGDPEQRLRVLGQIARQHQGCKEVAFFNL